MRQLRIQSLWWLLTLVLHGFAITLLEVIATYPQLSTLNTYVNVTSNVTSLLTSANNFTFLAASNTAISSFISDNPNVLTNDLLQATLQYSLLQGGYPTLSFSNVSQFVPTNLVNASYANVTGGQTVELVLGSDGTPEILTGNKSISTSTSTDIVCTGGIIHIINEVLAVPLTAVLEITAAGLEYFISILNNGGYLNMANTYVNNVLLLSDVTFFIPNSAIALANATKLSQTSTQAELQAVFEYHVVPSMVAYSPQLQNGLSLKTAQGTNLTITVQDGDTYVNAAKVIAFDYIVANGVVHVIDDLLNYNDTAGPPKPTSTSSTSSTIAPTATPTPTTATTNSTPTAVSAQPTTSKSGAPKSTIGIAVGVTLAGLITLAALVYWFFRARKRKIESGLWDDQSVPSDMGKFYVKRGTVQRQEDLGLGLQSTGMQEIQHAPLSEGGSMGTRTPPYRPSVPPRSPSRIISGEPF